MIEALQPAAMPCGLIDGERTSDLRPWSTNWRTRRRGCLVSHGAARSDVPGVQCAEWALSEIPTGWSRWTSGATVLARNALACGGAASRPSTAPLRLAWQGLLSCRRRRSRTHSWRMVADRPRDNGRSDYFQVEAEGGERWLFRRGDVRGDMCRRGISAGTCTGFRLMATYIELRVTNHFLPFLRGASAPEELCSPRPSRGIMLLDLQLGAVRVSFGAKDGQKTTGVRMIAGTQRADLRDGRALLLYQWIEASLGPATRLLSIGRGEAERVLYSRRSGCRRARRGPDRHSAAGESMLARPTSPKLRQAFGTRGYLALSFRRQPGDGGRLLRARSASAGGRRALRHRRCPVSCRRTPAAAGRADHRSAKATIDALGFRRERFMDRNLKPPKKWNAASLPSGCYPGQRSGHRRSMPVRPWRDTVSIPYEEVMAGCTAQRALARPDERRPPRLVFPGGVPHAYQKTRSIMSSH